jgi:hypothetical protein
MDVVQDMDMVVERMLCVPLLTRGFREAQGIATDRDYVVFTAGVSLSVYREYDYLPSPHITPASPSITSTANLHSKKLTGLSLE